jgi:hypothetical protein
MSVLAAMVTLAWGCLAVLTLAMAGMLRQLRELHTEVVALRADQGMKPWRATVGRRMPQLASTSPAVVRRGTGTVHSTAGRVSGRPLRGAVPTRPAPALD